MTRRTAGRRAALATVLTVVAGLGAAVLPTAPAAADDQEPVFDPGPVIASSPACGGRSGASQLVEVPVTQTPTLIETRSYLALSECDTQNLIQTLGKGAVATGTCTLAFKGLGTFVPPAKFGASVGELICGAATLGQSGLGAVLAQTDQNGGGCGVIIKYLLTITTSVMPETAGQSSVFVRGLRFDPRPCPRGVTPKADLGTVIVAGPPVPVDWTTYDYTRLPDLAQVDTTPVLAHDQDYGQPWLTTPPVTVPVPNCAPVKVSIAPTGPGAEGATVESVTGAEQFGHGRLDPAAFRQRSGRDVDYQPMADGTDTLTYTLRSEVLVTSTVTFEVSGCPTPDDLPEPWVKKGAFPVPVPAAATCALAVDPAKVQGDPGTSPVCTGGDGGPAVFVVLGTTCVVDANGQPTEPHPMLSYLPYACTRGTHLAGEITRYDVPVRVKTGTSGGTQPVNPDCAAYNGYSGGWVYGRYRANWSSVTLTVQAFYNGQWVDQWQSVYGGNIGGTCEDPEPMEPYYESRGFHGEFRYTGTPFAYAVPVSATPCGSTGQYPAAWNDYCGIRPA